MAVLDHLLDEDALDRLVAGAYVASAKAMKPQDRGDDRDRDDGCDGRDFSERRT